MERIAVEHRLRKYHIGHSKVSDSRAESGIAHRDTYHETQCKDAIDDLTAELRRLREFGIEMERLGIVGQCGEQHIIQLGYRSCNRVREVLSDFKFFEIKPCHGESSLRTRSLP